MPMFGKINRFIKLCRSDEPADKIYLRQRLDRLPYFGSVYRQARKTKASLFQRSAGAYLDMQQSFYETAASADKVSPGNIEGDHVAGSWREHNAWPDYETYLMKYVPNPSNWVALEYGCGPGRNILHWNQRFARIDGVDISAANLENVRHFVEGIVAPKKMPHLYQTKGMDCGDASRNSYDFCFSTICLQHICVYEVRFSIFKSLYECLKPGGRISFQMGYGSPSPHTVSYHVNNYQAISTNRDCDVEIADYKLLYDDLEKIGFQQLEHWIRPVGPGDIHPNWIFCTGLKPGAS
jgi:SAM-dependent methyltransferase